MNDNRKRMIKNIGSSLIGPIIVFIIMELLCYTLKGTHVINSKNMIMTVRNLTVLTCMAMALSCNITTGRFDFSLGAVQVAATIIGGNIALRLGLGSIGITLFAIAFGLVLSGIVGIAYCVTKMSPIVLSLGMALLYESVGFLVFDSKGLSLINEKEKVGLLSNGWYMVAMILIVVLIMNFLSQYTTFGYHQRALASGQNVSVNSGIHEIKNAIICYALSGGLAAIAGVINVSYKGTLSPSLGLSSVASIFVAMLPVFLGGFLASFSTDAIGKLIACIMIAILNAGMTVLGLSETQQSLLNALILITFLIYLFNSREFSALKYLKQRKATALAEKQ